MRRFIQIFKKFHFISKKMTPSPRFNIWKFLDESRIQSEFPTISSVPTSVLPNQHRRLLAERLFGNSQAVTEGLRAKFDGIIEGLQKNGVHIDNREAERIWNELWTATHQNLKTRLITLIEHDILSSFTGTEISYMLKHHEAHGVIPSSPLAIRLHFCYTSQRGKIEDRLVDDILQVS
jgi:hypothetical protein